MTIMNSGPEKPVERDTSPILLLGGLLAALVVFLVVCGIIAQNGTALLVEHREAQLGYGQPGTEAVEARARDEARLSNYEVSDQNRGLYQVPVEKAMEMLVDHKTLDLDGALTR